MFVRALVMAAALVAGAAEAANRIDRHALVVRHDVRLRSIDRHAPIMLGNGSLGFTVDITGLQTFPDRYAAQSPLLTMAQWAWHSFPNPGGWTLRDGEVGVPVPGRGVQPYAWFSDFATLKDRPALSWLRENPHRFPLGRIGLRLAGRNGHRAGFEELANTHQRLDLWRGVAISTFAYDGQPVVVETRVAADSDTVLVKVRSPLVASGRLSIEVAYPGVRKPLNPDPSDWTATAAQRTEVIAQSGDFVSLRRTIDTTVVFSSLGSERGSVVREGQHAFLLRGRGDTLTARIGFASASIADLPIYRGAAAGADSAWIRYWRTGGMIDFAGSTDPRARELERRVILSQYLARINQSGAIPPQEEGLYTNSWNGKFHLEMVPWHAAHWATWGRPEKLAAMMSWYLGHLPAARERAARHGVKGAWWPKMTGPEGRESPSPINPFIIWQQPHPVFLAELMRRARSSETDARYGELVSATADALAGWPLPMTPGRVALGPPVVPVQENHDPFVTRDPAFELAYWRWALSTAQQWRIRRGLGRNPTWDSTLLALPEPAIAAGKYLPVPGEPRFWDETEGRCRGDATRPKCLNRDHPSFLMAYGLLPAGSADPAIMARTLDAVTNSWDLRQLWGWDFPMIAMTAARLGKPEAALDWLFADQVNNRWGITGMTPRTELDAHKTGGPDGRGYRRIADTYFPSNGALLLAVGMMARGWDGADRAAPGFPRHGWRVRTENITPLP